MAMRIEVCIDVCMIMHFVRGEDVLRMKRAAHVHGHVHM